MPYLVINGVKRNFQKPQMVTAHEYFYEMHLTRTKRHESPNFWTAEAFFLESSVDAKHDDQLCFWSAVIRDYTPLDRVVRLEDLRRAKSSIVNIYHLIRKYREIGPFTGHFFAQLEIEAER